MRLPKAYAELASMADLTVEQLVGQFRELSDAGITCRYVPQAQHWLLGRVARAGTATYITARLGAAAFAESLKTGTVVRQFEEMEAAS